MKQIKCTFLKQKRNVKVMHTHSFSCLFVYLRVVSCLYFLLLSYYRRA